MYVHVYVCVYHVCVCIPNLYVYKYTIKCYMRKWLAAQYIHKPIHVHVQAGMQKTTVNIYDISTSLHEHIFELQWHLPKS